MHQGLWGPGHVATSPTGTVLHTPRQLADGRRMLINKSTFSKHLSLTITCVHDRSTKRLAQVLPEKIPELSVSLGEQGDSCICIQTSAVLRRCKNTISSLPWYLDVPLQEFRNLQDGISIPVDCVIYPKVRINSQYYFSVNSRYNLIFIDLESSK